MVTWRIMWKHLCRNGQVALMKNTRIDLGISGGSAVRQATSMMLEFHD